MLGYNVVMLSLSIISWWYSAGFVSLIQRLGQKLGALLDFFSPALLLKTLFAPFRQISANSSMRGPLGVQFRAWADKQFSRVVGSVVRILLLFACFISFVVSVAADIVLCVVWLLLPLAPIAGIVLWSKGWLL